MARGQQGLGFPPKPPEYVEAHHFNWMRKYLSDSD